MSCIFSKIVRNKKIYRYYFSSSVLPYFVFDPLFFFLTLPFNIVFLCLFSEDSLDFVYTKPPNKFFRLFYSSCKEEYKIFRSLIVHCV